MINNKWQKSVLGFLTAFAALVLYTSFLASPSPALAQDGDAYSWEGDWVLYFGWADDQIVDQPFTITRFEDGTFGEYWEVFSEAYSDPESYEYWPEIEIRMIFSIQDGNLVIREDTLKDRDTSDIHTIRHYYLYKTTNPDQLVGYWHDNQEGIIDMDFPYACASRNNAPRPDPCTLENPILLGSGTGETIESEALPEQENPITESAAEEAESPSDLGSAGIEPESDDQGGSSSDGQSADPGNLLPSSVDSQQGGVSQGAQAGAAIVTTGALAFWLIWEIMSWAPVPNTNVSFVDKINALLSSTSGTRSQINPPSPTPGVVLSSTPQTTSPPYTGSGVKETEIFGDGEVHAILQGLDLIPDDVGPGDTLNLTQTELDNLLSGHSDGLPHEITLPNGDIVIVDNIQGIAFHGDDSSTQIDFSQGISIVAEIVKPGAANGQPLPTPTPAPSGQPPQPSPPQPADQASVQPVDQQPAQPQPEQSQWSRSGEPSTSSGQGQTPGSDADLLEQDSGDGSSSEGPPGASIDASPSSDLSEDMNIDQKDQEIEDFLCATPESSFQEQISSGGQEPGETSDGSVDDTPWTESEEDEYQRIRQEQLDEDIDRLLEEIQQSRETGSDAGNGTDLLDEEPPEAGMIDGESKSATDDF